MDTLTAPDTAPTTTAGGDDDITHLYCCDPDLALCGTDLSSVPEARFDEPSCVVCADLDSLPTCGPGCPGLS